LLLEYGNKQGETLLDTFVFKIVPCLNPDGVSRGFYRQDAYGRNLNRFYQNPDPREQPTIYAVKQYTAHHKERLFMLLDLHAHVSKKGAFVFGNFLEDERKYLDTLLLPRCAAMNSINFDFLECDFSKESMSSLD
jgi:cytosolic carboxypeptidase protein 5